MTARRLLVPILAAAALGACQKQIEAPYNTGVCYHMVLSNDGKTAKFNELARNRPNLESCAAALEGMREHFLAMGGDQASIIGAYQGSFLFVNPYGVFIGQTLTGARYPALVRTGDGRLVVPGTQPAQQ